MADNTAQPGFTIPKANGGVEGVLKKGVSDITDLLKDSSGILKTFIKEAVPLVTQGSKLTGKLATNFINIGKKATKGGYGVGGKVAAGALGLMGLGGILKLFGRNKKQPMRVNPFFGKDKKLTPTDKFFSKVNAVKGLNTVVKKTTDMWEKLGSYLWKNKYFVAIFKVLSGILAAVGEGLLESIMGLLFLMILDPSGSLIISLINIFTQIIMIGLNMIMQALPNLVQVFATAIPGIIKALVGALAMIIKVVVEILMKAIPMIIEGIPKIVDALIGSLGMLFDMLINMVSDDKFIKSLTDLFVTLIEQGVKIFVKLISGIGKMIPSIIRGLAKMIPPLITAIVKSIPVILNAIIDALPEIINALVEAIPLIINALIAAVPQIAIALIKAFIRLMPILADGFIRIGLVLFDSFMHWVDVLYSFFNSDELIDMITDILLFPFQTVIEFFAGKEGFGKVRKIVKDLVGFFIRILTIGMGLWVVFNNFITKVVRPVKELIESLGGMKAVFTDMGKFKTVFSSLIKNIVNFLKDLTTTIWEWMTDLGDKVNIFSNKKDKELKDESRKIREFAKNQKNLNDNARNFFGDLVDKAEGKYEKEELDELKKQVEATYDKDSKGSKDGKMISDELSKLFEKMKDKDESGQLEILKQISNILKSQKSVDIITVPSS